MYAEAGPVTTDISVNTESNNSAHLLIVEVIISPLQFRFSLRLWSATACRRFVTALIVERTAVTKRRQAVALQSCTVLRPLGIAPASAIQCLTQVPPVRQSKY